MLTPLHSITIHTILCAQIYHKNIDEYVRKIDDAGHIQDTHTHTHERRAITQIYFQAGHFSKKKIYLLLPLLIHTDTDTIHATYFLVTLQITSMFLSRAFYRTKYCPSFITCCTF